MVVSGKVDRAMTDHHATSERAVDNDLLRERVCEIVLQTQDAAPLSIENVDRAVQMILEAVDEATTGL